MVADFPEAAAGSPEGVVVEVVIQETGTEAEADVSPAAVFREEAIVVVITVVETAAAVLNAETAAATLPEAAAATLPETAAATLPEAAEKAATPPPALDPTGPCNNAAAASDKTRKSHRQKKEEEERERQKDRYKTRVD